MSKHTNTKQKCSGSVLCPSIRVLVASFLRPLHNQITISWPLLTRAQEVIIGSYRYNIYIIPDI